MQDIRTAINAPPPPTATAATAAVATAAVTVRVTALEPVRAGSPPPAASTARVRALRGVVELHGAAAAVEAAAALLLAQAEAEDSLLRRGLLTSSLAAHPARSAATHAGTHDVVPVQILSEPRPAGAAASQALLVGALCVSLAVAAVAAATAAVGAHRRGVKAVAGTDSDTH